MKGFAALRSSRVRTVTLVALVCLAVVTAVLFKSTVAVYISLDKVANGDTTVTEITLDEDAEQVLVTVAFENPTETTVEIFGTSLRTRVNDTLVTQLAGGSSAAVTVGPHERGSVTVKLPLRAEMVSTAKEGFDREAASLVVSGSLKLTIRGEQTSVRLEWER